MIKEIVYVTLPHALLLLIGFTVIYPIQLKTRHRISNALSVALCYVAGEVLITLVLLLNSHIFSNFYLKVSTIILATVGLVMFLCGKFMKVRSFDDLELPYALLPLGTSIVVLSICMLPSIAIAFFEPLISWDARSIWFFHAKAFYFDNHVAIDYLKNPQYRWSHPEYPPLIPLLAVYHAKLAGVWNEVTAKSFLFVHWAMSLWLFLLMLGYLKIPLLMSSLVCVLIQLFFSNNTMVGNADSVFALAFSTGCISFLAVFRLSMESKKDKAYLFLCTAFLVLALSSLTKLEGVICSLVLMFLYVTFIAKLNNSRYLHFSRFAITFCVLVSVWYVFVELQDIQGEYEHSVELIFSNGQQTFPQRARQIAVFMLSHSDWPFWQWTMLLFTAAVLLPLITTVGDIWGTVERTESLFISMVILSISLLLFLAYLSTPLDLEWHLTTSFPRTASAIYMLCLVSLGLLSRARVKSK